MTIHCLNFFLQNRKSKVQLFFIYTFSLFFTGLSTFQVQAQTPNGFLDFGTATSNTTATTTNTGFGGVRVGSAGGSLTIQNPGQSIGTNGELRGIAPTTSSINSVGITSTEYGTATNLFTISFDLHLTGGNSGIWYFFAGNGSSFAAAQTSGFTSAQVFTGIRWTFGASNAISTDYRNGANWVASVGTPFAQNTAYQVSIIGNNGATTVNYGVSNLYSVAANRFDLWVNGVLVGNDLTKGAIPNTTAINSFRFYGELSTGNVAQIALDNVRWYNSCVLPPTHLNFVNVPTTGSSSTNLTPYTVEARSGSSTGPVADQFTGTITVSKFSGTGNLTGTLSPNAVAGVATYSNSQFDAAGTFALLASASAPIIADTSDNIVVSGGGPCVPPSTQASSLNLVSQNSNSIQANWTAGNGSGTMIVVRPRSQAAVEPSNGSAYIPNLDYALAEQINVNNRVVFRSSGTSALITNLNSQTAYSVTAYEYQNTGNCYNLTQASTKNVFTLSPEPASQITSLSVLANSATSINLNFPAFSGIANTDGYLVLMKSGSASSGLPIDSNVYTVSSAIGDATLMRIITDPNATSTAITGLTHSSIYYFKLIPFNWDSVNASTTNYLTSGTILQDFDTTFVNSAPVLGAVNTTSILNTKATVSANVLSDGGNNITSRGIVWALTSVNSNPVLNGTGCTSVTTTGTTGNFSLELTGLPSNSNISYVAFATNALGTTYSSVQTLQTLQVASQLSFGVNPPTTGIAGSALSTFTVEFRRPDLSIDQEFTGAVTVSKFSGSGIISGNLTVNAVNGVASFSNVKFNLADTYVIQVQATSFTSIQSASINITASSINLAYQNFETTPASPNWTYSGTGSLSSVSNRFVGAQSYQLTGTNTITFDNVNISEYTNVSLSVAYGATGVDTDEDLFIDISYDNGLTWTGAGSAQLVDGLSNLNLNINATNGLRTPTGVNPYVFSVPSTESQIRIRFRSGADVPDAGELFFIDEVKVSGIYNPNPILSKNVQSLSGFISNGLAQSSSIQTFTVSGNNLIDSVIITSSAGYEISLQDGLNFTPSSRIALNPLSGALTQMNIYVRMKPTTLIQTSGLISINSNNLTTVTIPLSGEVLNLLAGDIAFVGFDGVGPDRFSFVALRDIPENTRIWFTDKSWDGSLATPAFTSAEATGVWTSPSGGVSKGTVITMNTDPTFSVSMGTGGLVSGLSSVGEQLFAYQGTLTNPRFIAGFTSGTIQTTSTPGISETWIPSGLTLGLNFIKLTGTSSAAAFVTNINQINTLPMHRSVLNDSLNWTSSSVAVTFPNWIFKILVDEPTTSASFQSANPITNNSITLNFSGGNGSNCLIVMSNNPTISGIPSDGTSYTANSSFGNGSTLNNGEFVVYAGPVSTGSVLVSNLFSGTTYSLRIFSYNGSGNEINYLTSISSTSSETTTGSSLSQQSDVIISSGFTEPSLINFINFQEASNLSLGNSIELAKFTIRDGGALGDLDTVATMINTMSFVVRNSGAINKLALYNGSVELAEISLTDTLAAFSSFNLNVPDNSTLDISLRASFKPTQTDLVQMQFTLYDISTSISGSRFLASNGGAPSSSIVGDKNKINVVADRLIFTQQPISSLTGLNLNPAPIVAAVDNFSNRDLDFNSFVTLSSNKATSLSSVLNASAIQGLATFTNVSFSLPDTGIVLTANSGALTSASSNKFNITYSPQPGDVYISEISYESTQEWIELYNKTDYTINIGNWYITDHSSYPATSEGDCIIPSGTVLAPKSFVVVSISGTGTQATDLTDITGEVLTLAGPRGAANRPTLNNSGDNIALYTASSGGILMDGSLSVNFPDISNSSTISIQRIANKLWESDAFGRSVNTFSSTVFSTSSPGFSGSVSLQSSNSLGSSHTLPTNQNIDLNGNLFTINGMPTGTLTLKGSVSSDLVITGSSVQFAMDTTSIGTSNRLRNLKVTGRASLLSQLNTSGTLDLDSGSLDLNGMIFNYSGTTILSGNHSIIGSTTNSNLVFAQTGILNIPSGFLSDTIFQITQNGSGLLTFNESFSILNSLVLNGQNIVLGSNAEIKILNSSSNAIIRNSGYVLGPITRRIPANNTTSSTYLFPIGQTFYTPVQLINPLTNSGGFVDIKVQVFNTASNGVAGMGMSSLHTSRYFYAGILNGASNFVSCELSFRDTSSTAGNAIGRAATSNGTYVKVNTTAPLSGVFMTPALSSLGYFNTGVEANINATLSLTAYFEGLYLGSGKMTAAPYNTDNSLPDYVADTITVELHSTTGIFDMLYSWRGVIDTAGQASVSFPGVVVGNYYYLVVKHRNSLETWSGDSILMGSSVSYNFSTSPSQAYGNNMVDLGSGVFGIYSGDINQDGFVDGNDFTDVDNDNANFATGYLNTDTNGDGFVDGNDFTLIDNNGSMFVSLMRP